MLPNAEIALTNSATGYIRSTKTRYFGRVPFSERAPNQYKLQVTPVAFRTTSRPSLSIRRCPFRSKRRWRWQDQSSK